jgi:hypothetical protein
VSGYGAVLLKLTMRGGEIFCARQIIPSVRLGSNLSTEILTRSYGTSLKLSVRFNMHTGEKTRIIWKLMFSIMISFYVRDRGRGQLHRDPLSGPT